MENEIINFENKNFKKSKFVSLFESIYEHSDWVIKSVIEDKSNIPNTLNELRSAMKKVVNKSSDNLKKFTPTIRYHNNYKESSNIL